MNLQEQILETIQDFSERGGMAVFEDGEASRGYELVPVGAVPWLPPEDWEDCSIVSKRGKTVRLVALMAKKPCSGALSRLVNNIILNDMKPVIVEPIGFHMQVILDKWGWKKQIVGHDFETYETRFVPTKKWMVSR